MEARVQTIAQYEWHGVRERTMIQPFTVPITLRLIHI